MFDLDKIRQIYFHDIQNIQKYKKLHSWVKLVSCWSFLKKHL